MKRLILSGFIVLAIFGLLMVNYFESAAASKEYYHEDKSETVEADSQAVVEMAMDDEVEAAPLDVESNAVSPGQSVRVSVTLSGETQQEPSEPGTELSGNFIMGTDDAEAILWGRYDNALGTLTGEVRWMHSSMVRLGLGTYSTTGQDSGTLYFNFRDPSNPLDRGYNWTGSYGNGRWTITSVDNSSSMLSGTVFKAPQ